MYSMKYTQEKSSRINHNKKLKKQMLLKYYNFLNYFIFLIYHYTLHRYILHEIMLGI